MKFITNLVWLNLLATLLILGGCASSQPKLTQEQVLDQYSQVAELSSAVKNSKAEGAELFAPESYNKAKDSLETAMDAAHNNKQEKANEAATEGLSIIAKMDQDTQTSKQMLSEVVTARERAISAGVVSIQADKLTEMDNKLKKATKLLEDGKLEDAKQLRPELIAGYKTLELTTLEKGTTELAKSAINEAKKHDAEKYAPKTLAEAEEKLALAVSILQADRTQTKKANTQAEEARWLADKSSSIAETVKDYDRRDFSNEDIVLWYQLQLTTVNEPFGGQLPFNKPNEDMVQTFKGTATTVVAERDEALNKLKAAEEKYGEQLASTEIELAALQQKESENKAKFDKVQAMFTEEEANVYLQRNDVLISAHGFQFPSGQSRIQTANFPLMNKIIRAIKIFPEARIEITGHTDSTGTDSINLSISQERAEKVGKFLTDVGEISKNRIKTSGFGESRPVASNGTAEGRAENRRVEIKLINE